MTRPRWFPAYVGIGSNLDGPEQRVDDAFGRIATLPDTCLVARSGLYRSAPMGPQDQPDFVNAVAALLTQLAPANLLASLQQIEEEQGRVRHGERWGPRSLDLDLLAYADMQSSDDRLTLPHPGIAGRNFVLFPWREIAPHYAVPGLRSVAELAGRVAPDNPQIRRIG